MQPSSPPVGVPILLPSTCSGAKPCWCWCWCGASRGPGLAVVAVVVAVAVTGGGARGAGFACLLRRGRGRWHQKQPAALLPSFPCRRGAAEAQKSVAVLVVAASATMREPSPAAHYDMMRFGKSSGGELKRHCQDCCYSSVAANMPREAKHVNLIAKPTGGAAGSAALKTKIEVLPADPPNTRARPST